MKTSRSQIRYLLAFNALEVVFIRRTPGPAPTRRMLCTNDLQLLQSEPGRVALNYRIPTGTLPYNPNTKNLVVTWDLFMQDFRMISCENVELIRILPTRPPKEFWEYFNDVLSKMTAEQKMEFMRN